MKISFHKADFLNSILKAQSIISAKTPLPILNNLMIETAAEHVLVTATDLQVWVSCNCPAKITEEGATTLPARLLSSVIRELPGDEVNLATDSKDITTITCGRSFFKIMGVSRAEYPKEPEFPGKESFILEQNIFSDMIRKCVYAISREDSRYALMGLYFLLKDKKLTLVATDGRRLSKIETPVSIDNKFKKDFIVHLKGVEELNKLLGSEGEVKIFLEKNHAAFHLEHTKLLSRLIDGVFPDYERVIPESCLKKIKLSKAELLSLVKQVSTMTTEKNLMVRMKFEKEKLTLTVKTNDVGEARADMPIDYSEEELDLEVGFNPKFLADSLESINEDEIIFELSDAQSPGVIKADGSFIHVIMPMRLHEDNVDNE